VELADQHEVDLALQQRGDAHRHGHRAARDGQHQRAPAPVGCERVGELSGGIDPVLEHARMMRAPFARGLSQRNSRPHGLRHLAGVHEAKELP
jgi:hypothetical protein